MRIFAITAAVAALSLGATAVASPFSLNASTSVDHEPAEAESRGLIETIVDSTASAFSFVFTAGDPHEDGIILRYYKDKEGCTADETTEADIEPEADEEEKKLVGPEPIYFGF